MIDDQKEIVMFYMNEDPSSKMSSDLGVTLLYLFQDSTVLTSVTLLNTVIVTGMVYDPK